MKSFLVLLLFVCFISEGMGQKMTGKKDKEAENVEEKLEIKDAIISKIDDFFEGLSRGDTSLLRSLMDPATNLKTIFVSDEGESMSRNEKGADFIKIVGEKKPSDIWDEKIWGYDVMIDGVFSTVRTPYTFYFNEKLSHCGINVFQLIFVDSDWRIFAITDTRRKNACLTPEDDPKALVDKYMDKWHEAATKADLAFFDFMLPDAIYIGTDASERWTKKEFADFAMPYFKRGKAWDFKTIKRTIYLSGNGQMAWFEESLDTWMGECRASGVLQKMNNEWKIAHYHLSVTVPNDLIKDFIELVEKGEKK